MEHWEEQLGLFNRSANRIDMRFRAGFTLIEMMIVVILMGILVSLATPSYVNTKEKALDKEAIASLRLIRAANKQYYAQRTRFYPETAVSVTNRNAINGNLSIDLRDSFWSYNITGNAVGGNFTARALRSGNNVRQWVITNGTADPTCSGAGCV